MKKRAPIWKRATAYLIDLIIINFVIATPFSSIINSTSFFSIKSKEMLLATIIISILSIAYWTLLEYKLHQSIGKIILKLEVKKNPTFTQALIRNISKPFFLLLTIDVIYLLFTKRRLFEKWSNTWVERK